MVIYVMGITASLLNLWFGYFLGRLDRAEPKVREITVFNGMQELDKLSYETLSNLYFTLRKQARLVGDKLVEIDKSVHRYNPNCRKGNYEPTWEDRIKQPWKSIIS